MITPEMQIYRELFAIGTDAATPSHVVAQVASKLRAWNRAAAVERGEAVEAGEGFPLSGIDWDSLSEEVNERFAKAMLETLAQAGSPYSGELPKLLAQREADRDDAQVVPLREGSM